jgi:hypothetical protein
MHAHWQSPPSLSQLLAARPIAHTPPAHVVRRIVADNTTPENDPAVVARGAARRDAKALIQHDRAALLEALRAAGPGAKVSTTALARDHGMSPQRAGILLFNLASSGLVQMHKSIRCTQWSIA